jgi:hypothetical protein
MKKLDQGGLPQSVNPEILDSAIRFALFAQCP